MKNSIVLLAFLLNVCSLSAQFTVTAVQTSANPLRYDCTIVPSGVSSFSYLDLITWIFPDGQFMQQEIEKDQAGNVINSSTISWQPYITSPSGPDSIIAYVAKKGKPGNPALIGGNPSLNGTPVSIPAIAIPGTPAAFAMPASATWQINQAWEFAPNASAFLVVSYKLPQTCSSGNITLSINTNQIEYVATETLAFQNENITPVSTGLTSKSIEITNLKNNGIINHVYVKLKLANPATVGAYYPVSLTVSDCGTGADSMLQYRVKGVPHDPNEKLVNHRIVCPANTNQTDLNYSIKFQNDGNDFVDSVEIEDQLPSPLLQGTFALGNVPDFHRVYGNFDWIAPNKFSLLFKDLHLPGLKQTNPHYAYDQTTYSFDFNICTDKNLIPNTGFVNNAEVYFYDKQHVKLPVVFTSDAKVSVEPVVGCYNAQINCILPAIEQAGIINSLTVSPNPFGEDIRIFLDLEEKTRLKVIVRDLNGRIINSITDGEYVSGAHLFSWNGTLMPAGIYLLDVYTERGRISRKIIKM